MQQLVTVSKDQQATLLTQNGQQPSCLQPFRAVLSWHNRFLMQWTERHGLTGGLAIGPSPAAIWTWQVIPPVPCMHPSEACRAHILPAPWLICFCALFNTRCTLLLQADGQKIAEFFGLSEPNLPVEKLLGCVLASSMDKKDAQGLPCFVSYLFLYTLPLHHLGE